LVVARRADAHEPAGALPIEVVEIVSEPALDRRCIHFRFGDGLGCPSSNREYRDRRRRITAARGRFPAASRWHPSEPDENDCARRSPSAAPGHPGSNVTAGWAASAGWSPGNDRQQWAQTGPSRCTERREPWSSLNPGPTLMWPEPAHCIRRVGPEPVTELDLRSPEERGQMSLLDGECGGWCEAERSDMRFPGTCLPIPNSGEMRR
jgi:hypothetical protein